MDRATDCVFLGCTHTTRLLEQQEVLFPPFSVLFLLFSQGRGGVSSIQAFWKRGKFDKTVAD